MYLAWKVDTNRRFSSSSLPMNHGLPTISPSAAVPAISPNLGELLPLPPMNKVSGPMPSWRACNSTPETGSTNAEIPTASGLSARTLVNCAEKSVSLLPNASMATMLYGLL